MATNRLNEIRKQLNSNQFATLRQEESLESADMSKKRERRIMLAPIGEYYEDLLLYDCFITGRQQGMQAASLLCAKLQEREQKIEARLEYLAEKRNISVSELKKQIRDGQVINDDAIAED